MIIRRQSGKERATVKGRRERERGGEEGGRERERNAETREWDKRGETQRGRTRTESATVLDCTHSATKRATNLHTFTLHGFCYPIHPSLSPLPFSFSLSHFLFGLSLFRPHVDQSERDVELGWASVSTVAVLFRRLRCAARRSFSPRGLPIKRSPEITRVP